MQEFSGFDLDQLRAFLAIADAGSLKAAARLIGRDVAIVSRRLKALETRLGIRLVERNTRRVALTAAGEAYRDKTAPLIRALEEAEHDLAASTVGRPRGHLRVAAPVSFGQYWLRPLIVRFLAEHPDISIECELSNRYVDLVAERFDVAIRLGVLPDSSLIARRVATRRRRLYAAPSFIEQMPHLRHPRELASVPCIGAPNHHDPRRWSLRHLDGEEVTVSVSGQLSSDDAGLVVEAAAAGLGVLLTGEWYVTELIKAGRLVVLLPDWTSTEDAGVFVVTTASSGRTTAARAFREWISKRLKAAPWAS